MIKFIRKIYRKYFDTRSPFQFEIDCLKKAIWKNEFLLSECCCDCDFLKKQDLINKLKRQRDRVDYLTKKIKK
jgi:hypothetical protein